MELPAAHRKSVACKQAQHAEKSKGGNFVRCAISRDSEPLRMRKITSVITMETFKCHHRSLTTSRL